MPIAMEEDYLGRSGNRQKRELKFVVTGTDDDAAVIAHVEANAPSTHDGLVFSCVTKIEPVADMRWKVAACYGALAQLTATVPEPDVGTASYTFNLQAEPETFFYSKERVARFPPDAPQVVNGLIGIQLAEGRGRHAGVAVPAGPVTDRLTYEYPAAVIPSAYRNTVRALMGGVANGLFLDEPTGSMRFVSCSAQITSTGKQTIEFGFANRPNEQRNVGPYDLGVVHGWDFHWSTDMTTILTDPATNAKVPIITPRFVYVERLLPRVNFGNLGLPSF